MCALFQSHFKNLLDKVVNEMNQRNIKIAGEKIIMIKLIVKFLAMENIILRSQGKTRPVSILQIRSDVRKYSCLRMCDMLSCLHLKVYTCSTLYRFNGQMSTKLPCMPHFEFFYCIVYTFMQLMNLDRLLLLLWILLYLLLFCIKFTTHYGRVFTLESCIDVLRPLTVPSWSTWMPGTCTGNFTTMSNL